MIMKKITKKYIIVIYFIFIAVTLSACTSTSKKVMDTDVKWDISGDVGDKWKQGQYQFKGLTESESGYYYTNSGNSGNLNILYFFDKLTGKSAVVCDQANCKHNDEKCPAYLPTTLTGFCYYNGYIYYISKDENQSTTLYKMDYDGHNKKNIMTLFNINEAYTASLLTFHRDNLFYSVIGENNEDVKLYRIDMKKNEKELLVDVSGNVYINDLICLDNNVYYDLTLKSGAGTMTSTISQYNIETGDTKKLIDGEYCNSYTVTKDYIYYATNHNVNKHDIKSGNTSILLDDVKWGQLSNDGIHLYLDVDKNSKGESIPRNIFVYDWNDKIIDSIQVQQSMSKLICLFGDTDYLFLDDVIAKQIYYLDKTKIGTNDHEWLKTDVIK